MPIKNLLFDLGGVIIDLHIQNTREAFEELGMKETGNWFVAHDQNSWLNKYETGQIDTDAFIAGINKDSGLGISEKDFKQAWNAMLGKVRRSRLEMLENLREKYRVFALSNINPMHAHACHEILERDHDIYSFHEIFDRVFFSHEINARKPDKASFDAVLKATGIHPEETLFFDDHFPNVEAAARFGFLAQHVDLEISVLVEQLKL
ncbi:MAG: HAD-IA family hydrolase [Bacteroidetes bacterium]|nr:HAD-IA family hydrolase [Bacteroidota bacterium]